MVEINHTFIYLIIQVVFVVLLGSIFLIGDRASDEKRLKYYNNLIFLLRVFIIIFFLVFFLSIHRINLYVNKLVNFIYEDIYLNLDIWKTYTSKNKKFSLKYPQKKDWKIEETSESSVRIFCDICRKENNISEFTVAVSSRGLTLENYLKYSPYDDYKMVTIDGHEAIKSSEIGGRINYIIVINDEDYFAEEIRRITINEKNVRGIEKANPDIISTLKFISK